MCFKNIIEDGEFIETINLFTEEEYLTFANGVFVGKINKFALPSIFYTKTAYFLQDALNLGLEQKIVVAEINSPDWLLRKKMTENVYFFSAAKTYQQAVALSNLIVDKNGMIMELDKYLEEAKKVLTNFNENYLLVERNMALAMGRGARDWQIIQEDMEFLPMLQYETVGDRRVRPEHARLDNITKPANDPFWDTYFPPNGWRCRCTTLQLTDSAKETKIKTKDLPKIDPLFSFNPGVRKIVFSPEHPYFTVPKQDIELKNNNFGFKELKI